MDEASLILKDSNQVYHLGIGPNALCENVITVGDPERIDSLLPHFEKVQSESQTREFRSVSGLIRGKPVLAISTGMGTDNIEILINELEILANLDLGTRKAKAVRTQLNIVRLGTSGAWDESLEVDELIYSSKAFALDNQHLWYPLDIDDNKDNQTLKANLSALKLPEGRFSYASKQLSSSLDASFKPAVTYTANGFYRNQLRDTNPEQNNYHLSALEILADQLPVHNFEMETAGIYRLASFYGHQALSISCILAQRKKGSFSENAALSVNNMIDKSLELLF